MVPAALLFGGVEFLGAEVGELVDPDQMLGDAPVGEVMDVAPQPSNLARDGELFMDVLPLPPRPVLAEQADLAVGIPARVADPLA